MLVTLSGIVIDVSPEQPENALCPMLVTPFGIVKAKFVADENLVPHFGSAVTAVSPEHPVNASFPMLVTPSGIVIDVSPEQL